MQQEFTRYYNEELRYLREMGAEFAEAYPKIAGRLGIQEFEVADPYVERLLEGFAFLSARVRLKLDAEFPRFTRHFLDLVCPTLQAPMPSVGIVELNPAVGDPAVDEGVLVPRGSSLLSPLGQGETTRCTYRTAHDVTLWPIELVEARYLKSPAELPTNRAGARAGIQLRLRTTAGQSFSALDLDALSLYLTGSGALPGQVLEAVVGHGSGVHLRAANGATTGTLINRAIAVDCIEQLGFAEHEALLPVLRNGFSGHRLLMEYAACPARFQFVSLNGLRSALAEIDDSELTLTILLDSGDDRLLDVLQADNFRLFATPVINLFECRADRITLSDQTLEHQILADRTKPLDFEIYDVLRATATGGSGDKTALAPLFDQHSVPEHDGQSYFVLNREPRNLSAREKQRGTRSSYAGSEVFLSLVRPATADAVLRQVDLVALCSNRDLPLRINPGVGTTDFDLAAGGPVASIRLIGAPTAPRPAFNDGESAWRLINALSVNYLTLIGEAGDARTLKELLRLFAPAEDRDYQRRVDGIQRIASEPALARVPSPGAITYGRGLRIDLTLDESAFEGSSAFQFGTVIERFLARSVTINAFTRTHLHSQQRGEIGCSTPRPGLRPAL